MCYTDKLIVMPEHATLAPPICRLAGEVLSIGRRVTQKGVLLKCVLIVYIWPEKGVERQSRLNFVRQTIRFLLCRFLLTALADPGSI